ASRPAVVRYTTDFTDDTPPPKATLFPYTTLFRSRKDSEEDIEADFEYEPTVAAETKIEVPQIDEQPETESVIRKKQLEKMAKEKPEEFAKLLRNWISEE